MSDAANLNAVLLRRALIVNAVVAVLATVAGLTLFGARFPGDLVLILGVAGLVVFGMGAALGGAALLAFGTAQSLLYPMVMETESTEERAWRRKVTLVLLLAAVLLLMEAFAVGAINSILG